jgi:subtilisin family serine protease
MRRPRTTLLAVASTGLMLCGLAASPAVAADIPGGYIVTLRSGDPAAAGGDAARRHGADVVHVYRHALRGYAARMSARAAAAVARQSDVASVVADRTVSASAQTLPTGNDRIDAELSSARAGDGTGSVGVDVAVIDTGIDLSHPDLTVSGGRNCNNGRSFNDGNGHGTHVAGTIGAKDNGIGVVGVAPGARLWAVRVLNNNGSGSWSSVICGIDWVTANAGTIEVANMSLGGSGSDTGCNDGGLHQAICNSVAKGVTYAVAAGNESDDAANHVPAAYDEVITVSALADFNGRPGGGAAATCRTDNDDTFAEFSNFGADVDLIAPGVCILSTWKGGGYNTISGTSMATPHVAGAAALYKASHTTATPAQVKAALQTAGNLDWSNIDDHDSLKESLLGVASF